MTFEMSIGTYQSAVDRQMAAWSESGAARRLFDADHNLWTTEPQPEITDRLGWLTLPEEMQDHAADLADFSSDVAQSGITDVVLLGMGGSSLAPEVFQRTFGSRDGYPSLTVLDSTHPAAVAAVATDPATTLYVVASKSGTTIEPLSFLEFFWAQTSHITETPGDHFVAITDPGSHLESMAAERDFRRTFIANPHVGGRYSALTHFGLVPAALIGADVLAMLAEAAPFQSSAAEGDAGFALGAALGHLTLAGRDKATFFTSDSLAAFPVWVEQLIAESTGKEGTGILPVADEAPGSPAVYGNDRVFVSLTLSTDDHAELDAALDALAAAGHPVIRIAIDRPEQLAAEMYRAEVAVAMASSVLGIHPFNQPDVQAAKTLAKRAMAGELDAGSIAETPADGDGLSAALAGFLETANEGNYLAIQAFIAATPEATEALQRIRHLVRDSVHMATTVGFGPRFLHSTGQFHKGGPDTGLFLQMINHAAPDLPIPGAGYGFAALVGGQADGDFQALAASGRRVIRVCLGDDVTGGLAAIEGALRR
jgi:transaldolase/glucose-6-phosphate isomerase